MRHSEEVFIAVVGCRLARLIRLFDAAATLEPEARNRVDGLRANLRLDEITADLQARSTCDHVWDAPIEELWFEPIDIDHRYLLEHPENMLFPSSMDAYLALVSSYPQ